MDLVGFIISSTLVFMFITEFSEIAVHVVQYDFVCYELSVMMNSFHEFNVLNLVTGFDDYSYVCEACCKGWRDRERSQMSICPFVSTLCWEIFYIELLPIFICPIEMVFVFHHSNI